MGVGVSLLLIIHGAILAWAVNIGASGVDVNTLGYVLLALGMIGLLLSLVFSSSRAGRGSSRVITPIAPDQVRAGRELTG